MGQILNFIDHQIMNVYRGAPSVDHSFEHIVNHIHEVIASKVIFPVFVFLKEFIADSLLLFLHIFSYFLILFQG